MKKFIVCITVMTLLIMLPQSVFASELGFYATTTKSAYTMGMLQNDILYLAQNYPEKFTYYELGRSTYDQPVYQLIIGNRNATHAVFIQASMHAREYINTQLVMAMCEYYVKQDLKDTCFYVMPMVNPDGIAICQAGNRSYKANANGVDINRNFPVGWYEIPAEPVKGQYKGTAPLSEVESTLLKTAVNQRKFELNINYHSKGNVIYYTSKWASPEIQAASTNCASLASSITGYESIACTSNSEGATFADYVVSELKIPYITIESGSTGCPVKQSEFTDILKHNLPVWNLFVK